MVHNDECRKRLEEKLREGPEGNERLQKAEHKINEELERLYKRDRGDDDSLGEGKRRRAEKDEEAPGESSGGKGKHVKSKTMKNAERER